MPGSTEDGAISVRTQGSVRRRGKVDAALRTSAPAAATALSPRVQKRQDFLVKNDDAIAASQSSVLENKLVSHLLEKVVRYVFFLLKRKKKKVDPNDSSSSGQTPQRRFV